ncbi:MAG TPA: hypothetical protein PKE12_11540 [Kiritimatiellia bacterium]|nr:hypothetical protein [Kiritimatiellia bacterium]
MNTPSRSSGRFGALLVLALVLSTTASHAYTLIVAPARFSVIQVAMDVLSRSPSVLVSYQGEPSAQDPVLHAWNGGEWVPVSLKDYREVNFLQRTPDRTVLIGNDNVLPQVLLDASSWSPRVERISDLTTGALINEFGRILKWRSSDWKWFTKRYNLTLTDESEPRRHSSWYDQQGPLPDRPRIVPPAARPSSYERGDMEPVPVVPPAQDSAVEADPVP